MGHDAGSDLDLDLLRCFDHLHRERNLTQAARRVGLSQPAMSRALGRLRDRLGDPLFVRTPRGMIPTPRADALAPEIRAVLERVHALASPPRFDPAALRRTFVISSTDYLELDVLPGLSAAIAAVAPDVTLTARPRLLDRGDMLASGACDLQIGVADEAPDGAQQALLFEDGFQCAVSTSHPLLGTTGRLTLERFVALDHVLIAPRGEPGSTVDSALAALGRQRRVAVRTSSFLAAPLIVARSQMILTAPARMLVPIAKTFGLRLLPPPLALPPYTIRMYWHPRMQHDPAHAWFRGLVAAQARNRST